MFDENCCPDCGGALEIVESFGVSAEYQIYGCKVCDATYTYSDNSGCLDPGGFKKQLRTLTKFKKELADRPQAAIRSEKKDLEEQVAQIRLDQKAFKQKEESLKQALNALKEKCTHPNKNTILDVEQCSDCDWLQMIELPLAILQCLECSNNLEHVSGGGHDGLGGFFGCQQCNTIYKKLSNKYQPVEIELMKFLKLDIYKKRFGLK